MGEMYLKVLLIMAVLFTFMIPGVLLKKFNMLGEGASLTLSRILLYVCQPALAVKAFCVFSESDYAVLYSMDFSRLMRNFLLTALISALAFLALFLLCKAIFFKWKDKKKADVYSFVTIFSNCGFLGIPFIQAFTGNNPLAVMYMMIFNVVQNVCSWTLGVYLITGTWRSLSWKKIVFNPTILANAISLVLFCVPQINIFMFDGLKDLQMVPLYLSYMTAPLSMFIVGIKLVETPKKLLFNDGGTYLTGGLRLLLAPAVKLGIGIIFKGLLSSGALGGYEEYVYLAPVIAMAMSPAAAVVAMAEAFDGDKQTATVTFITNTLISIAIIPLTISLAMLTI